MLTFLKNAWNFIKTSKWLLLIIACLIAILSITIASNKKIRYDRDLWKENTKALSTNLESYRINDSISAVKISGLVLSLNDAKNYNSELMNQIKNLRIKNKELASVIAIQQEQLNMNPDTIYVPIVQPTDTTERTLYVHYNDTWTNADIEIVDKGSAAFVPPNGMQYQTRDSIYIGSKIKYKGCWFWKRPIGVEVHLYNSNPHSTIVGGQYIELRNRKRPE